MAKVRASNSAQDAASSQTQLDAEGGNLHSMSNVPAPMLAYAFDPSNPRSATNPVPASIYSGFHALFDPAVIQTSGYIHYQDTPPQPPAPSIHQYPPVTQLPPHPPVTGLPPYLPVIQIPPYPPVTGLHPHLPVTQLPPDPRVTGLPPYLPIIQLPPHPPAPQARQHPRATQATQHPSATQAHQHPQATQAHQHPPTTQAPQHLRALQFLNYPQHLFPPPTYPPIEPPTIPTTPFFTTPPPAPKNLDITQLFNPLKRIIDKQARYKRSGEIILPPNFKFRWLPKRWNVHVGYIEMVEREALPHLRTPVPRLLGLCAGGQFGLEGLGVGGGVGCAGSSSGAERGRKGGSGVGNGAGVGGVLRGKKVGGRRLEGGCVESLGDGVCSLRVDGPSGDGLGRNEEGKGKGKGKTEKEDKGKEKGEKGAGKGKERKKEIENDDDDSLYRLD